MWRYPYNPTAYDDDWEGQPGQGWFYKWVLGVAGPLWVLVYGIRAIAYQTADVSSEYQVTLEGSNAIAVGCAALSLAVFVHCHYFWGNIYDDVWFAVLGKIISAMGFIASLGVLLVRFGIMGYH
jgi:hypothetical protein